MVYILNLIQSLIERESGQDLVEYGLVIALVSFGAVLGLKQLGGTASIIYSAISSTIQTAL
ncbi:MAG TPA: Flp family type IVb pilin [Terracidiphilus sp.]|nr:Flp family type IVb pilin [Terracidiphilus sp.]